MMMGIWLEGAPEAGATAQPPWPPPPPPSPEVAFAPPAVEPGAVTLPTGKRPVPLVTEPTEAPPEELAVPVPLLPALAGAGAVTDEPPGKARKRRVA